LVFSKEMQSLWSSYFYYIPMFAFLHMELMRLFLLFYRFSLLLTVMVMNIDLSRYQLATLTSVIESVRNHER
jgi:hypothetical protein